MTGITQTINVLGGKPRIKGTRISVGVVNDYLSAGYGINEIKRDYPHLTDEQIDNALNYLEKKAQRERVKLELKTT